MKIEFIKETKAITGEELFFTEVEGEFMAGTLSYEEPEALKKFEALVESAKLHPTTTKETVKSVEI